MKNLQKHTSVTPRDSISLDLYLRDIAQYPLLSPEEEVSLALRIHAGDEKALEQMVLGNLRFVVSIAKNYVNCGLELPDLISAGNIGLVTAAKRFDETMGFKFCSYAVWWIRQSIMKAITKEGRAITLPANQMALLTKINREASRLEQELGHSPSREELTERLDVNEDQIERLLRISEKPLSLDAPLLNDDDIVRIDTIADSSDSKTDDNLMKESLHIEIEKILSNLAPNERSIIKMYFGIDHPQAYSMEEIALRMSLSRERVRQIHNKAISRLQRSSCKEHLRTYL